MQHCSEKHATSAAKRCIQHKNTCSSLPHLPSPPPSRRSFSYLSGLEMKLESRRRAVRRNREQREDEQNQITKLASCVEQQRRWVQTWTGSLGRLPTTILSNWCDTPEKTEGVDEGGEGCQRTRVRQANLKLQITRIHFSPHFTALAEWVFFFRYADLEKTRRSASLHPKANALLLTNSCGKP